MSFSFEVTVEVEIIYKSNGGRVIFETAPLYSIDVAFGARKAFQEFFEWSKSEGLDYYESVHVQAVITPKDEPEKE